MSQAEELNRILRKNNEFIYELLSEKGRGIFFPKEGIISQSIEARGKKINATIGIAIEDDHTPMRLPSIAKKIDLDPKDVFPYASSYGKQELREKWKAEIFRKNPSLKSEISMPIVTSGLTHGLSLVGYLFLDKGDKIIIPKLLWGNYKLIFEKNYGAVLERFNTFKEDGFDLDSFKEKLSSGKGKKVVLLNFPNNPTGYTPNEKEAREIIEIVKERASEGDKIIVICDDAYFGLFYEEGLYRESLFSLLSHENILAIKIDGVSKECYSWGLRVGFITFSGKGLKKETLQVLEDKTAGAVRGGISNVPHPSQSLVLGSLNSPEHHQEKEKHYQTLKRRFEKVKEVMREDKYKEYFTSFPYNSGYFMCLKLKNIDAEKVRQVLLEKYNTGIISLPGMLRVSFSCVPFDNISLLFENIYNACKEVRK